MSTTSNVTDTNAIASLANQLFKRVDANNDGQLSNGEFKSFLESLLSKTAGTQTGGTQISGQTSSLKTARQLEHEASGYQGMLGFDYVKLNTATHATAKYVFARATQDLDFGWDRASRSASLEKIADYAKNNGYADAKVTGDDTIDFGDGNGDIDILTGDGQWWWGPKG